MPVRKKALRAKKAKKPKKVQKFGVVGLIRDGNGNVLLQKRGNGKFPEADGKWEFPGGKVDFGESPAEALEREIQEEVGCTVSIARLLPIVMSKVWTRANGGQTHALVLCYECFYMGGTPRPEEGVSTEVAWFKAEDIRKMDVLPGIPAFLSVAGVE
jgi:8-oxo-dGTP diphosphatase